MPRNKKKGCISIITMIHHDRGSASLIGSTLAFSSWAAAQIQAGEKIFPSWFLSCNCMIGFTFELTLETPERVMTRFYKRHIHILIIEIGKQKLYLHRVKLNCYFAFMIQITK